MTTLSPTRARIAPPRSELHQPANDALDDDANALVDRWAAELEREPDDVADLFHFLVAVVAAKRGELREISRGEHDGRSIVVLVDPSTENFYGVKDARLCGDEAALVAEMERALGG